MANRPAAVHPHVPEDFLEQQRANAARRVRRLMNSGVLLIAATGSVIIQATTLRNNPSVVVDAPVFALVAFLLFLFGFSMVMLALVVDQFPRAARVGEAVAAVVLDYLFAGEMTALL
ncbi:hypothetical protein EJB05_41941, partial [Eragrostis curvula]